MDGDLKMNPLTGIKKLNDARGLENWKAYLAVQARKQGAKDIINGNEVEPTGPATDPDFIKKHRDWEKRDAKMQQFIMLTVSEMEITRIRKMQTSRVMFETICGNFEPEAGETLLQLRHTFDTMVWEKKESFDQFYSRLIVAKDDVTEAGRSISDIEFATKLLAALPSFPWTMKHIDATRHTIVKGS